MRMQAPAEAFASLSSPRTRCQPGRKLSKILPRLQNSCVKMCVILMCMNLYD